MLVVIVQRRMLQLGAGEGLQFATAGVFNCILEALYEHCSKLPIRGIDRDDTYIYIYRERERESHPGVDRIPGFSKTKKVIFQTHRYNMAHEAVSEWTEG